MRWVRWFVLQIQGLVTRHRLQIGASRAAVAVTVAITHSSLKHSNIPIFLNSIVPFPERIDIFTRKVYRDIIIDSLKYCQKEKGNS
ncbi:MAG: hypothetical protein JXB49_33195 [Bacteroidales bacterium]|nr:hypothetical protein [Bacteroidales bacterium]